CEFFGVGLVRDDHSLETIRKLFAARGLPLTRKNEDQALVPAGCVVIPNNQGTAPGYFFERDGKFMFVLPGVPFEMKGMMESFVIPAFAQKIKGSYVLHKTLKTTGIAESILADQIGDVGSLFSQNSGISLAYLPSPPGVRLRISVRSTSREEAQAKISEVEKKIRTKAQKYLYGEGDEELEDVVGRLLAERGWTIAVAESCTGGLIMDRITNVSGSSRYFERGFVTYSNASKTAELGVLESLIEKHGAVSREVAVAMAEGVRQSAATNIGISTTGIAGPTGGTDDKPVGLVWIGFSSSEKTFAMKFNFGNDRRRFKERASQAALELVRRVLLNIE
ncbi:MAG TPA: nicotinamide-nucleotide amidohydrolase family protein, partial [Bacteroidota bacterium]